MGGILGILNLVFGPVIGVIGGYIEHKQKMAEVEREAEVRVRQAEVESHVKRLESAQEHEQNWEIAQIQNSGWKDEYLTIVLSIPLIACFIPGLDVYVLRGFNVLLNTPEWYRWTVMIMIGAVFGYRKIADFMDRNRNGNS